MPKFSMQCLQRAVKSDAKKIDFIIANSSMIKRPIIESSEQVKAMGFVEDEYKKIKWG